MAENFLEEFLAYIPCDFSYLEKWAECIIKDPYIKTIRIRCGSGWHEKYHRLRDTLVSIRSDRADIKIRIIGCHPETENSDFISLCELFQRGADDDDWYSIVLSNLIVDDTHHVDEIMATRPTELQLNVRGATREHWIVLERLLARLGRAPYLKELCVVTDRSREGVWSPMVIVEFIKRTSIETMTTLWLKDSHIISHFDPAQWPTLPDSHTPIRGRRTLEIDIPLSYTVLDLLVDAGFLMDLTLSNIKICPEAPYLMADAAELIARYESSITSIDFSERDEATYQPGDIPFWNLVTEMISYVRTPNLISSWFTEHPTQTLHTFEFYADSHPMSDIATSAKTLFEGASSLRTVIFRIGLEYPPDLYVDSQNPFWKLIRLVLDPRYPITDLDLYFDTGYEHARPYEVSDRVGRRSVIPRIYKMLRGHQTLRSFGLIITNPEPYNMLSVPGFEDLVESNTTLTSFGMTINPHEFMKFKLLDCLAKSVIEKMDFSCRVSGEDYRLIVHHLVRNRRRNRDRHLLASMHAANTYLVYSPVTRHLFDRNILGLIKTLLEK
jgi:hypothetical protein